MTTPRTKRRASTGDRGPPPLEERVEIHTAEQIGPNMSRTPAGFLVCREVPIARVGWMVYGPGETPVAVDPATGLAHVHRGEEDLFTPECIGSFMGSPVIDEHPEEDITAENWVKRAQGFSTTNVRRGTGADSDVLLADLLITDAALIKSVLAGKREVSCGYDADYEQTGVGQGKQTNIIGNHIALVEKGRCGPRCAIGDRAHQPEGNEMATRTPLKGPAAKRRAVLDAKRKVLDAETALAEVEAGEEGMDEDPDMEGGGTHIHIHGGGQAKQANSTDEEETEGEQAAEDDRVGKLETMVATIGEGLASLTEAFRKMSGTGTGDEEPDDEDEGKKTDDDEPDEEDEGKKKTDDEEPEDKDKKDGKTTDSAALATGYAQVASQAEILVPGFRMPTFDAKAKRKSTVDAMCSARRKALGLACATNDGAALVTSVNGGVAADVDAMGCADVATLFKAAAGAKALLNNASATKDSGALPHSQDKIGTKTIADINKANADYWAARQAAPK